MNISLRLEFCGDGGPIYKKDVRFDPSQLVFQSNDSIRQLSVAVSNISTDTNKMIGLQFLQLKNKNGPFAETVQKSDKMPTPEKPPVDMSLKYQDEAAVIVCYSGKNKKARDRVAVNVDGERVNIPISTDTTELDFGCNVANHETIEGEITLVNLGSESKEFKIEFKGSQLIVIKPTSGLVSPHSEQRIKVELETKHPGEIKEKMEVSLGYETKSVHVLATLKKPRDILSQDSEDSPSPSAMENVNNEELPKTMEAPDRLK